MNFIAFKDSLKDKTPPADLTIQLKSLWYDGKGDWETAHHLVNDLTDKQSAHIHAYLHRKEGDLWNADYWYNRAGKRRPTTITLDDEWGELVATYL